MSLQPKDFELLLQANRILSSKLKIDEVLEAVLELATKVVRAEAASLLLLDEHRNELYFDVALGSAKESVKQIRLKVGEGIAGWVAKERLPLIVNDVKKDQRFSQKADKSTKFKTRSILAVPLLARGKLVGVVEAINKELNADFSTLDQEAFEVFASQAAIAIENARLFTEVSQEREKLNTVFTEMSDGIIFLDDDQDIVFLNDACSRYLDLPIPGSIGKKFNSSLLPEFTVHPSIDAIKELKEIITPIELTRTQTKDLYLAGLIRKLKISHQMPRGGTLLFLRDITEEKRGEFLKRNFLSLVSHKLRTPLTVILGYGPALLSKSDNFKPFQKKAIQSICDQGEHLSGLVDKLLRFTLVDSEELNKKMETKSLDSLLQVALKNVGGLQQEKKVSVSIDETVKKLPPVSVDESLTVEVFKNLLENGIKFNDKDEKKIVIRAEAHPSNVVVLFEDNGVGIPSEEKENVFQKFYQIENSFTGQVPGAGLGLPLCKRVMEEMGGRIEIDSKLGKGTTVSVGFQSKEVPVS